MVEGPLSDSIQLWLWNTASRDIRTTIVPSISKALTLAQRTKFDVIFLDFHLRDPDEIKTVINMINHKEKIPILVCSSNEDSSIKNKFLQHGATEYISKKKINPTLFISKVRNCVEANY
jgi:CheY-like chemotaxis protein